MIHKVFGDGMVSLTLSIPPGLKERMDRFSEINWSEVAKKSIIQKIKELEFLEEFKSNSTMDEQLAIELGRKVNKALAARYSPGD